MGKDETNLPLRPEERQQPLHKLTQVQTVLLKLYPPLLALELQENVDRTLVQGICNSLDLTALSAHNLRDQVVRFVRSHRSEQTSSSSG